MSLSPPPHDPGQPVLPEAETTFIDEQQLILAALGDLKLFQRDQQKDATAILKCPDEAVQVLLDHIPRLLDAYAELYLRSTELTALVGPLAKRNNELEEKARGAGGGLVVASAGDLPRYRRGAGPRRPSR